MRKLWLILALSVVGCGDDPSKPEPDPEVTGAWELVGEPGFTFNLTLSEGSSGSVQGTGELSNDSLSIPLSVSGDHDHPDLILTFTATGFQPFTFSGEVDAEGERISGELNGSGWDDFGVVWQVE